MYRDQNTVFFLICVPIVFKALLFDMNRKVKRVYLPNKHDEYQSFSYHVHWKL